MNDKTERIAVLAVPAEEARRFAQSHQASAPVQAAAMELLATLGECACKELGYYTGATSATLRRLEKLELLTLREQEILPPPPRPQRPIRSRSCSRRSSRQPMTACLPACRMPLPARRFSTA